MPMPGSLPLEHVPTPIARCNVPEPELQRALKKAAGKHSTKKAMNQLSTTPLTPSSLSFVPSVLANPVQPNDLKRPTARLKKQRTPSRRPPRLETGANSGEESGDSFSRMGGVVYVHDSDASMVSESYWLNYPPYEDGSICGQNLEVPRENEDATHLEHRVQPALQSTSAQIPEANPAPNTAGTSKRDRSDPPKAILYLLPHDQARAYADAVGDENCVSVKEIDSLRSIVIHSEDSSQFEELGSAIKIRARPQKRRLTLEPGELPLSSVPSLGPNYSTLDRNAANDNPPASPLEECHPSGSLWTRVLAIIAITAMAGLVGALATWILLAYGPDVVSYVFLPFSLCQATISRVEVSLSHFGDRLSTWLRHLGRRLSSQLFQSLCLVRKHSVASAKQARVRLARHLLFAIRRSVECILMALERLRDHAIAADRVVAARANIV